MDNRSTPDGTEEKLGKNTDDLRAAAREKLHSSLMTEFNLEKIDTEVEKLGYLVLKKKDETVGIYSLRTHSLIPFPGSGNGKSFIKQSGTETDKIERVYISVGGVEKEDDVIGICAFFILANDKIEEVKLTEECSLLSAIIKYGLREKIDVIDGKWERIQKILDGANGLLDGVNEARYHRSNNTLH